MLDFAVCVSANLISFRLRDFIAFYTHTHTQHMNIKHTFLSTVVVVVFVFVCLYILFSSYFGCTYIPHSHPFMLFGQFSSFVAKVDIVISII